MNQPEGWAERQRLLEMLHAYRASQVLITCAELGVFRALYGRSRSASDLASELGVNEKGLARLLDTATALGLLRKNGQSYANSPLAETCLAAEGPAYLGAFIEREGASYRRWGLLTEAVETGRCPDENRRDEVADEWVRGFEYALFDLSRLIAPVIAEALNLARDRPLRVLDVGGGHGNYSIALAHRYPALTADVLELPKVVPVAREIITREGMAGRVRVIECDFQQNDLGSGYDLVLLFGVLAGETPAGRAELIRKTYRALASGGQIAVREFVLTPDRTGPPQAALFALQMLLATEEGGASTTDELAAWLQEAGFSGPRWLDLPSWAGTTVLCADKPSGSPLALPAACA